MNESYLARVKQNHQALNIPDSYADDKQLPLHVEASELVEVFHPGSANNFRLTPVAAKQWTNMNKAAKRDGITLELVSTFRGLEYQHDLIKKKLDKGQTILEILTVLAPPGYSEHHTGRAIDFTTDNCPPCVERFEKTDAFDWLDNCAHNWGFKLSYPRNNPYGFVYEPWHWAYND